MQNITPFLWFNNNAEEAVNFYVSIFKNSKIEKIIRFDSNAPGSENAVITIDFKLNGQAFAAINGGPMFTFSPAISFVIDCESQEEVDYYWDKLSEDGEQQPCAWLKDKFGISWQVVPKILMRLLQDKDPVKSKRVMDAMFQMTKIDIKTLEEAYQS
jgi:predicted 3-demethylubiquinone-9 3-methyltransferase (glyoxalase superfamily)